MHQSNLFCQVHQSYLNNWICLLTHNCQKVYCLLCEFKHIEEAKQFLSKEQFQKYYFQVLDDKVQLYRQSIKKQLLQQKNQIKTLIGNIEIFQKLIEDFYNHIIIIFNDIEIQLQQNDYLLERTKFPNNIQIEDFNKINGLKKGNQLNYFIDQQPIFFKKLDQFVKELDDEIKLIYTKSQVNIKTINQYGCNQKSKEFTWQRERVTQIGVFWDLFYKKFENFSFEVEYSSDGAIRYYGNDGSVLRIDQLKSVVEIPKILLNDQQIKNLQYLGVQGKSMKKVGKWRAFWKGQLIKEAGGCYFEGIKQGLWMECSKNFCLQSIQFQKGSYLNDQRRGRWSYYYQNIRIGGGRYNLKNQKNGKWLELSKDFNYVNQILYNGEYLNGHKFGLWVVLYRNDPQNPFKQIGGGLYQSQKFGKWVELWEGFQLNAQVTCSGEYNFKGIKVGKWDYMFGLDYQRDLYFTISQGCHQSRVSKVQNWVELSERFHYFEQPTFFGQDILKYGKRAFWQTVHNYENHQNSIMEFQSVGVGENMMIREIIKKLEGGWICLKGLIFINRSLMWVSRQMGYQVLQQIHNIYLNSGCGFYDYEGNQKKIGMWVEIFNGYSDIAPFTSIGQYNTQGKKIGVWLNLLGNKQVGGGLYNQDGDERKIGKWKELGEIINLFSYEVYSGQYNIKGIKIGRWDRCFNFYNKYAEMQIIFRDKEYKFSGGGLYDQDGRQKKIGKWVELIECLDQVLITSIGEYNTNGMKVGRWGIICCELDYEMKYNQIGCGSYDQEGNQKKIGKWVEVEKGFSIYNKLTSSGKYNMNGIKVGRWEIMHCKDNKAEFKKIGGGCYDGCLKKIGLWVELFKGHRSTAKITFKGEYNINGIKVGRWDFMYCKQDEQDYKKIGGGSYDQKGNYNKIGKWVELDEMFELFQKTYNGEYNKEGIKIGIWNIKNENKYSQIIQSGFYNQQGIKFGKWIEQQYFEYQRQEIEYNSKGQIVRYSKSYNF